ncbi:hypothetical protein ACFOD9_10360 [Novosphingobium bradum]|uniref:Uncharacterized protein n=1 Tax=Novosphingobium bradum TaxID=1737444 RepID=A0ABV7IST5_9SPHN
MAQGKTSHSPPASREGAMETARAVILGAYVLMLAVGVAWLLAAG